MSTVLHEWMWKAALDEHRILVSQIEKHVERCAPLLGALSNWDNFPAGRAVREARLELATCRASYRHLREMLANERNTYNHLIFNYKDALFSRDEMMENHKKIIEFHNYLATLAIRQEQLEAEIQHYLARERSQEQSQFEVLKKKRYENRIDNKISI